MTMGYLKMLSERVDKCGEEIDARNRRNFVVFANGGTITAGVILIVCLILPLYRALALAHGVMFLYTCLLFFLSRLCMARKTKYIRAILYAAMSPYLIGAALLGSVLDPARPAVSIIICVCILPLFITDKPWRIIAYQLFFTALFIVCAYFAKPAEVFAADMLYMPIYLALGIGANIFSQRDKVESAENYVNLRFESEHDALTGLHNRGSGTDRVTSMLASRVHGTFAIIDIDDFKQYNDRFGHTAGDDVLRGTAEALRSVFRASDVVWRLGGDEFAVFAVNLADPEICRRRFDALSQRLEKLSSPQGGELCVRVSVGCCVCCGELTDFESVYRRGDAALYKAKERGKNRVVISGVDDRQDMPASGGDAATV